MMNVFDLILEMMNVFDLKLWVYLHAHIVLLEGCRLLTLQLCNFALLQNQENKVENEQPSIE